jgi:hypothetical protein
MNDARRANVATGIVILLAGALSSVWVFLVPIFQAPDEPAHFDYAISIYSAGRLIRLSDGRPDWIVSPYTKYLMRAADFDRIAWHSSMRVPAGYGTHPYFARVDAGGPGTQDPPPASGRISYIAPLYPFGFYGLEALWMRIVSLFTGSLVALFFAARLLCVFLMMVGLYFNYRTALNLGVPRWIGVALVAAIGFFPLTSFVSSYVQPDNLAYALVSAALFFATQLSRAEAPLPASTALGVALGFLAITKYQFFLCAAIPLGILFVVRSLRANWTTIARASGLVALVTPSVALLGVQHAIVAHTSSTTAPYFSSHLDIAYFHAAIASGLPETLRYAVTTSLTAFTDLFVWGACAATFWQVMGWFDTPLVIGNAALEMWIRLAIALTSLAVAGVLAFRLSRNAISLLRAAARHHGKAALTISVGDPVFNTYLCFIAMMLALYVFTNNAFGAEGRQLYPLIFPAFLCFIWYAPRTLSRRHRALSAVFAAALLGYVLVASGYALADVAHRYYGPQVAAYVALDPAPSHISSSRAGVLWPVVNVEYHVSSPKYAFDFQRGARLRVDGAAIFPKSRQVPSNVAVMLDSYAPLPVMTNQYLFLVAEATHSVAAGYSGFYADIDTTRLPEGAHVITAYTRLSDRLPYHGIAPARLFFVTGEGGIFSSAFIHSLDTAPIVRGSLEIGGSCGGVLSFARGTPTIAPGGALLFSGRVQPSRGTRDYSAVWMSVDRRPYPAIYNVDDQTFVGTIPTSNLAPGLHQVAAYALSSRAPRDFRISQSGEFRIAPGQNGDSLLVDPPAVCTDSLRELAGT